MGQQRMSDEDSKLTPEDQPEDKVDIQIEGPTANADGKTMKKRCRGRSFALIYLILIIGLAGGYVYLWKELQQTKADLLGVGNNVQAGLTSENMVAMEDKIKQLEQNQREQSDVLASLFYRDKQRNNEDWAIAEVEYLLIIAMHRLFLEEDITMALAAMEAADLRLKNLGDPGLLPVRQQLAADMNQLRAINQADIAGMAIYLADIIDLSADLPLKSEMIAKANTEISANENQADEGLDAEPIWKKIPRLLWREIKSLVVIKRTDEIQQALLLPSEEYYLIQNLRLELESARLSVLSADSGNLRASIVLIQSWLQQYFDTSDSAVINVVETLEKMQEIELKPALPDISSSAESLRAYLHDVANSEVDKAVDSEEASAETGLQ